MQFLMLNHPVDCGICDKAGECRLQDYEYRLRPAAARARRTRSTTSASCTTSARASSSTTSAASSAAAACASRARSRSRTCSASSSAARTRSSSASIPSPIDDPYSDNVIGLCPTGALLSRDFLYQSRVWFLEPVRSVCTGCSRGCSIDLWRRKKEWRLRSLGRGAQQHAVPRHRPREPRDQRSLALQQGLRPAQADEQGADADAHARRRAGIDRTGARPGPRPDRASAQVRPPSSRRSPPTRSSTSSRRRSARASASMRARTSVAAARARWSRTTS